MAEVINKVVNFLVDMYDTLKGTFLFGYYNAFINLIILSLLIIIISVFIWKFCRTISQKNVLVLNLNQYNKVSNPFLKKLFAMVFYFFEYLFIIPFVVLLWFSALSLIMLFITNGISVNNILLISAAVIIAVRILSYFNEELSRQLAKLFPFVVLSFFILSLNRIEIGKVLEQLNLLSVFSSELIFYSIMIFGAEVVMRLIYTLMQFIGSKMKR